MSSPRVKNTASAKDLRKVFLLHIKEVELDIKSFREEEDHVIKKYEALMLDIIEETLRPTEKVLQTAIVETYSVSHKDGKAIARGLHTAFKYARSKLQSASSGTKLAPSTWRVVQRMKELSGTQSSPAKSSPVKPLQVVPAQPTSACSPIRRMRFKGKGEVIANLGPQDIFAQYGLSSAACSSAAASSSKGPAADLEDDDVEIISHGGTVISSASSDQAGADLQAMIQEGMVPGGQKPYFDPSAGCYVRVLAGGQSEKAELSKGPAGFCLAQFPGEHPFTSQVPNLWLETQAKGKGPKLKRARGKAVPKKKAKAKAKAAEPCKTPEPLEKEDEEAEEEASEEDEQAEQPLMDEDAEEDSAAAAPGPSSEALIWQGYDLSGMPESCHPPAGASGKHSYTIRFDENAIAIDVLCNKRAFYVKKPEKHKGQWTWNSFDSISACLKDLLRRCREDVSRPTVRELS